MTIEAPVEGELGKVYSTAPEVAIGSDGKTYNTRQAKPAAHVVTGGPGQSCKTMRLSVGRAPGPTDSCAVSVPINRLPSKCQWGGPPARPELMCMPHGE